MRYWIELLFIGPTLVFLLTEFQRTMKGLAICISKLLFYTNCIITGTFFSYLLWYVFLKKYPIFISIIVAILIIIFLIAFGQDKKSITDTLIHLVFGIIDGIIVGKLMCWHKGIITISVTNTDKIITYAVTIILMIILSFAERRSYFYD